MAVFGGGRRMTCDWPKTYFSLILLAAMILATGSCFSGEEISPDVVNVVAVMRRALMLTDAQVKQVASVVEDYLKQVQELKNDGVVGTDLEYKMKLLRDDMNSNFANYLTEEQLASWKQQMAPASDSGRKVTVKKRGVLSGSDMNPVKEKFGSQTDNGVLESGSFNQIKSSGVW